MDKEQLLLTDFEITGLGTIYAPRVREMVRMGMERFNKLLMPFLLQLKDFTIPEQYANEITMFDVLLLSDNSLKDMLKESLKFFYRTNEVVIGKDGIYININSPDNLVIINRDNFQLLSDTILEICMSNRKDDEEEEKLEYITDKGREALLELMELRKQHEVKNNKSITMFQLINVVVHEEGWLYKDVMEFTYAQLINSYKCAMQQDNYRVFVDYKTSGQFDIKDDIKHWSEQIE